MAQKRMFSLSIVDSDAFISMPASTQNLYFHLCMRADDDGFVSGPRKIQRMIGASDDDMQILLAKRFLLAFESGVMVVKHWWIHNTIKNDRYHPTLYAEEKSMLYKKPDGAYTDHPIIELVEQKTPLLSGPSDVLSKTEPEWNQDGTRMEPQIRLDKNSLDNIYSPNLDELDIQESNKQDKLDIQQRAFNDFWNIYPRHEAKQAAFKAFKKLKKSEYPLLAPAIKRQIVANEWTKARKRYIPLPSTWLNGRRWEDEIETASEKATKAARWLSGCLAEKIDGYVEPNEQELFQSARGFDAIHDMGYEWNEISKTALWAVNDEFWGTVINSGEAFHKNFVKILAERGGGGGAD